MSFRGGFSTGTGLLGALVAFPAILVAVLCGGLILIACLVGNLADAGPSPSPPAVVYTVPPVPPTPPAVEP